jgi:hypothetical protein
MSDVLKIVASVLAAAVLVAELTSALLDRVIPLIPPDTLNGLMMPSTLPFLS